MESVLFIQILGLKTKLPFPDLKKKSAGEFVLINSPKISESRKKINSSFFTLIYTSFLRYFDFLYLF